MVTTLKLAALVAMNKIDAVGTTTMQAMTTAKKTPSARAAKVPAQVAARPAVTPPAVTTPATSPAVPSPEPRDEMATDPDAAVHQPRLWKDNGWTAKVIKNEDDEGWAVAMYTAGESEPALVGPWTMGRDKKNPKPLDVNAFNTLVKTASEVIRRHEQQLRAQLHKQLDVSTDAGRLTITLDIVPDEFEPYALLAAQDAFGDELAQVRVRPDFRLNTASAQAWADSGFARPR